MRRNEKGQYLSENVADSTLLTGVFTPKKPFCLLLAPGKSMFFQKNEVLLSPSETINNLALYYCRLTAYDGFRSGRSYLSMPVPAELS